eukprot:554396-Rhodomonas_salina.1
MSVYGEDVVIEVRCEVETQKRPQSPDMRVSPSRAHPCPELKSNRDDMADTDMDSPGLTWSVLGPGGEERLRTPRHERGLAQVAVQPLIFRGCGHPVQGEVRRGTRGWRDERKECREASRTGSGRGRGRRAGVSFVKTCTLWSSPLFSTECSGRGRASTKHGTASSILWYRTEDSVMPAARGTHALSARGHGVT